MSKELDLMDQLVKAHIKSYQVWWVGSLPLPTPFRGGRGWRRAQGLTLSLHSSYPLIALFVSYTHNSSLAVTISSSFSPFSLSSLEPPLFPSRDLTTTGSTVAPLSSPCNPPLANYLSPPGPSPSIRRTTTLGLIVNGFCAISSPPPLSPLGRGVARRRMRMRRRGRACGGRKCSISRHYCRRM